MKYDKIKEIVIERTKSSTVHGFPNIVSSDKLFVKLTWILCVLSMIGLCSYIIIQSILSYFEYEVIKNIEIIDEIPSLFPTITICSINPYLTKESEILIDRLVGSGRNSSSISGDSLALTYMKIKSNLAANLKTPNVTDEQRRSLGFDLDQVMISCVFSFRDCTAKDFVRTYDYLFGNCYRFNTKMNNNSSRLRYVTKQGKNNGIKLELFIPISSGKYDYDASYGAHVYISNDSVIPNFFEGFDISTGLQTNVVVSRFFTKKEPYPYSECVDNLDSPDSYDSYLYRKTLEIYKVYRQRDCFDLCFQDSVIQECNCYITSLDPINSKSPCINLNQTSCNYAAASKFYGQDIKSICGSRCPLECVQNYIYTSISSIDYPKEAYADNLLKQNIPAINNFKSFSYSQDKAYSMLKKQILSLNIYYEDLKYTIVSDSIKTSPLDFVSALGGTLGLFLGMSFLSLVELVEILIEIFYVIFNNETKIEAFRKTKF